MLWHAYTTLSADRFLKQTPVLCWETGENDVPFLDSSEIEGHCTVSVRFLVEVPRVSSDKCGHVVALFSKRQNNLDYVQTQIKNKSMNTAHARTLTVSTGFVDKIAEVEE